MRAADPASRDLPAVKMSIFSVQDHHPTHSRTVSQFYEQILVQAELADRLGYDTFWVAEHHFHEYGVVPNPAVLLAALAQRTKRLRLGSAISILTFHNPLTVAESYAMVDVLSAGRLMYGVGSGYLSHEFAGYGIDPVDKRDRFDDTLAAVKQLLTGERVSYSGTFHSFENVKLNIKPLQQPIPIFVAMLRKEGAYHIGKQGNNLLCVPYVSVQKFDEIAEIVSEFRRGRTDAGITSGDGDLAVALHCHVAESDEKAREIAEKPFNLYVDTRIYAPKSTYDDAMRNGFHLFGSPVTVANKLVQLKKMGVNHVMALQNFGSLEQDHVLSSMTLLMNKVMPMVTI
jgi:alkanesulfonate monooxygenase SsuD/methylene tetrahydromethanopterin reductase-like flavin-dependent oxidoreductase (luciferase family)